MRIGAHRRRALRRSCRKAAVASNRWTVRAEGFLWNDQRCQKHADRTILYGASNGSRCKDPVLPHAAHGCLPCGDGPRRHYFWRSRMAQTKEKENTCFCTDSHTGYDCRRFTRNTDNGGLLWNRSTDCFYFLLFPRMQMVVSAWSNCCSLLGKCGIAWRINVSGPFVRHGV